MKRFKCRSDVIKFKILDKPEQVGMVPLRTAVALTRTQEIREMTLEEMYPDLQRGVKELPTDSFPEQEVPKVFAMIGHVHLSELRWLGTATAANAEA